MPEKPLKLNSIDRFSKRSTRLVLEEHSHCEVPAGCGGVVLRWINPAKGVSCKIRSVVDGDQERSWELRLDGSPTSTLPFISCGRHVFSIVAPGVPIGRGFLIFTCVPNRVASDDDARQTPSPPASDFKLLSSPDGTWRATTTAPHDDSWQKPGFDDSTWPQLAAMSFAEDAMQWGRKTLEEAGAIALGFETADAVEGDAVTVYVRVEFELKEIDVERNSQ